MLIGGVAGIAWLTQFQPSGGRPAAENSASNKGAVEGIDFLETVSDWDPGNKAKEKYVQEFELGKPGHYDFEFENRTKIDMDLGMIKTSCTCTGIEIALFKNDQQRAEYRKARLEGGPNVSFPLDWTKLEMTTAERGHVTVSAGGGGLLRYGWNGTKPTQGPNAWSAEVWSRPAGGGSDKKLDKLEVAGFYVPPVMFEEDKIDVGTLNPKETRDATFRCWSATRDLVVKPLNADKRIQVEVTPLSPEACKKLADELLQRGLLTRVKSGVEVHVRLFEEIDGKQLDMGLLLKPAPIEILSDGTKLNPNLPTIRAAVRGPVVLNASEQGNRIELGLFSAKRGTTKKVTVMSPKDAKLSFAGCDPVLLELGVELKEGVPVESQTPWELIVTAKPGRIPGPLAEDGVLVLECKLPPLGDAGSVVRQVRIGVVGTASSSD
jgi:hypothetical protein